MKNGIQKIKNRGSAAERDKIIFVPAMIEKMMAKNLKESF